MDRWLRVSAVALLAAALWFPVRASATLTKPSGASVKFVAVGPAGLSIVGQSADLKLVDDGQSLSLTVPLSPLHTGIGLRDRHMKEKYLEVGKYPNAVLRVPRKSLKFPAPGGKLASDDMGELTLHGRKKQVKFHYEAAHDTNGYQVSGSLRLNMKEYAIDVPSYLGVTVKPDVDVSVQFHVGGG